jgi:hypothetical protein
MKLPASLTAAAFLAVTGLAHAAGTISSPAIYGGSDNIRAVCAVRNVGKTQTTPALTVFDESGNALVPPVGSRQACNGQIQPVGSTCNLLPGGIFWLEMPIAPGVAYACSATGNTRNLRGVQVQFGDPGPRRAELR